MMTNLWFIFLLGCIGLINATDYQYQIKHFEVPLDHFSYATNKTFQIRYLINDTYVRYNSPILFYTGNEGDIELFAQNTGFMWEIAPKLGALLVFAEHRYYGKSLPFGNKSYDSPDHLGYLTSEQALADFADLLQTINPMPSNELYQKNRPVIALGGSYGGMLSAWFRMKYPHLVTGAIAASAPILQFTNLGTPCDIFSQIVTSVFATANTRDCSTNIQKSWTLLTKMLSTSEGRSSLNVKFKFCKNLTKPEDQETLFDYLNDVYGNLAMANYPYDTTFLADLPAYPVREFCRHLDKPYADDKLIDALQSAVSVYSNYTHKATCLDISSAYNIQLGDAGWDYQSCTEMVMPHCSTGIKDMFPKEDWNFKAYSDECFKKFGIRPKENAAVTYYGGSNLDGASNIVFSNGLLDPWSGGGVMRSPNDKVKIIIIPEGAHHLDLRAANKNDPGSVRSARKLELQHIEEWIRYHYKTKHHQ